MLKFYVCVFLVIDICCISCTKEIPSASIINPSPPPLPPPPSPTANINFQFTPFDALSLARTHIKAATAKGKLVFAGGAYTEPYYDPYWGWGDVWIDVNNVDIYDTLTGAHTTAELSGYAMYKPGALGSKVYFPLGYSATGRMDIYDVTTNDWSTVMLSEARGGVTILSSGEKIFFAGGWGNSGP